MSVLHYLATEILPTLIGGILGGAIVTVLLAARGRR